jgi:hypothetical protein
VFCYCTVILSHYFNTSLSSHFSIHPCFLLLLDVLRVSPSLSASAFAGCFPPFAITGNLPLSPLQGASTFRGCQAPSVGVFRLRHHWVTPHLPFFTERLPLFAITRRLPLSDFFWALSAFHHHWATPYLPLFAITGCLPLSPLQGTSTFHRCRRPRLPPAPSQGTSAFQFRWALSTPIRRPRLLFLPSLGVFRFLPSQGALCHHFPLLLCASHISL